MIIANLKGGLGNQMFQYACGRALALRNTAKGVPTELKLDASGYARMAVADTPRSYALDVFDIKAELATTKEIFHLKYPFGIISKGWRFFRAKVLRRFYIGFFPSVLSWTGNVYLDGFWQTEKYFKDFEKEIRADFTPKRPLETAAAQWHDKISHDPYAVSLHIRRGDYASDKATNRHWGTCDLDYYDRALARIAEKVPKPNIYVFSDDMAWVKENLATDFPISFIPAPPEVADHEAILLMAACKHNIIANSSFSWWGAWLNQNPAKMVIAPSRWANEHNEDWYADIIPESWTRL